MLRLGNVGTVRSNPFAELPLPTTIDKRDRVLNDQEATIWGAASEATHSSSAGERESNAKSARHRIRCFRLVAA
jgi:hypothetical protein